MAAVPSPTWLPWRPPPTTPGQQYLIKVEEHSATSHLVPLQCHVLVEEQLAGKPEVSVCPALQTPMLSSSPISKGPRWAGPVRSQGPGG